LGKAQKCDGVKQIKGKVNIEKCLTHVVLTTYSDNELFRKVWDKPFHFRGGYVF
jgi:hypothetical protein